MNSIDPGAGILTATEAVTAPEYGLFIGLIALFLYASVSGLGQSLIDLYLSPGLVAALTP